ncbi:MAG: GNAT family N-acetyltransferase [Methyloligellaceae bacterium]
MRDAPEMAALHGQSFPQGWSDAAFERFLADHTCSTWIARRPEQGPIAGFLLSRMAADEADIVTLAVAEDVRRHGLGSALVECAAAALGRRGARRLLLEVGESNLAARGLYAACGFRVVGARSGYYRSGCDGEDAVVMERRLQRQ